MCARFALNREAHHGITVNMARMKHSTRQTKNEAKHEIDGGLPQMC